MGAGRDTVENALSAQECIVRPGMSYLQVNTTRNGGSLRASHGWNEGASDEHEARDLIRV